VSVCLASNEQISVHHRSDSPTIGIRAYGLKWCLILLKNKSCQNCVLTIPLCRGGRDEHTGENRVKIGHRTWLHAPTSRLATRADACHASSSLGWADPTRIPDEPTHMTDSDKDDIIMSSACIVDMPCQR
jgi:hypothetical protein